MVYYWCFLEMQEDNVQLTWEHMQTLQQGGIFDEQNFYIVIEISLKIGVSLLPDWNNVLLYDRILVSFVSIFFVVTCILYFKDRCVGFTFYKVKTKYLQTHIKTPCLKGESSWSSFQSFPVLVIGSCCIRSGTGSAYIIPIYFSL